MTAHRLALIAIAAGLAAFAGQSGALAKEFTLTIKDHRFSPATLTVPADEEFDLTVVNADPGAEEFESNDFHVEKVIAGGKHMTFHIGPLSKGEYGFFGERHMDTALGRLFAE